MLGSEVAGELDGQRVLALPRAGGRLRRARRGRSAVDVPAAGRRDVRGGRVVPDDVPDRVHPAAAAGARDAGVDGARPRRLGRRRLRGDPGREAPRRAGRRDRVAATRSARSRASPAPTRRSGTTRSTTLRVDVVIDPVGGEVFTRSLPLLNPLGAIVAIGFAGGLWSRPERAVARRPQRVRRRLLPRAADEAAAGARARGSRRSCSRSGRAARSTRRRVDVPARPRRTRRTR